MYLAHKWHKSQYNQEILYFFGGVFPSSGRVSEKTWQMQ